MMTSLTIKGFRSLRQLTVEGLTQVSLLVGANNAGKTSVLEAAELVLGGDPAFLYRSPTRRGESTRRVIGESRTRRDAVANHLFHGHRLEPDSSFYLEARDGVTRYFKCRVISFKRLTEQGVIQHSVLRDDGVWEDIVDIAELESTFALEIKTDRLTDPYFMRLTGEGVTVPAIPPVETAAPPIRFVETASLATGRLRALWDKVVLTPEESKVTEVLQIIEPSIERIAALSSPERGAEAGIFVKLKDFEHRIPIGSMGEGIKRLLGLSLNLAGATNGYLLVDEIDTGLHYSVMVKMWRLVVEAARRLNVQVLATTHSLDCVEALAALYEEHREVRDLISLHRIERDEEASVSYPADEILSATQHRMELR